jgi:5-methylcytosine-specific restriction endonuclease McrA
MVIIPLKRCTTCGKEFPATTEYFNKQSRGLYGVNSKCKSCTREYDAQPARKAKRLEYLRRPETKAYLKARRQEPEHQERECRRARSRADYHKTYRDSPDTKELRRQYKKRPKVSEKNREYARRRRLDPEFVQRERERDKVRRQSPEYKIYNRVKSHNRRAREARADGRHTLEDVKLQFISQKGLCWWCSTKLDPGDYHIDHRIPLDRGGTNWPNNICVTCPKCNLSKGKKLPHEWNGRLL